LPVRASSAGFWDVFEVFSGYGYEFQQVSPAPHRLIVNKNEVYKTKQPFAKNFILVKPNLLFFQNGRLKVKKFG
jgi:hypothetical protein